MTLQINIASLIFVNQDGEYGLFALDSSEGKVYKLSFEEASPELTGKILSAVRGNMRNNVSFVPTDQVEEVMKIKKEIANNGRSNFGLGSQI